MSLLISILIGVAVGAAGGFLLLENMDYLLINIVLGLVGSVLGWLVFIIFGLGSVSASFFSVPAILCSIIGAMLAVLLFNAVHRTLPKRRQELDPTSDKN